MQCQEPGIVLPLDMHGPVIHPDILHGIASASGLPGPRRLGADPQAAFFHVIIFIITNFLPKCKA